MKRFTATLTLVLCAVLIPGSVLAAAAVDNAGNAPYGDGWQAGDNGGSGFGPWTFAFTGDAGALAHPSPQFIDTDPPLTGNSLGSPAFALTTSDRAFFFDTSEATRTFGSALAVGETFHLDVDGSAFDPGLGGFSAGNTVQLFGSDAVERWGMFTNNGFMSDNWVATSNMDTGIPAGNAFHIAFTLTGPNSYDLLLTPVGGGAPLFSQSGATLAGTAGAGIASLRISDYGTGSSADGTKELFFNNPSVVVPEPGAVMLVILGATIFLPSKRRSARR